MKGVVNTFFLFFLAPTPHIFGHFYQYAGRVSYEKCAVVFLVTRETFWKTFDQHCKEGSEFFSPLSKYIMFPRVVLRIYIYMAKMTFV